MTKDWLIRVDLMIETTHESLVLSLPKSLESRTKTIANLPAALSRASEAIKAYRIIERNELAPVA